MKAHAKKSARAWTRAMSIRRTGLLRAVAILVGLGLAFAPRPAEAHPLDMASLKVESRGTSLTIVLELAPSVLGVHGNTLDVEALANASYRLAPITTNAGPCRWTTTTATIRASTNTLVQTGGATCPAGATSLRWELPIATRMVSSAQILTRIDAFGHDELVILGPGKPLLELAPGAAAHGFRSIVWAGVEHIGATPDQWHDASGWKLAAGLDHVLFVLALLLAGGTLWQLLGISTGFTVGHSITLALASLGIVQIPASIIEPLVALTIAVTALEAFTGRWKEHRWKIATAFGLVHGFAFAGALSQHDIGGGLATTLFGFNLGVELGQLVIILCAAPAILALHHYKPAIARVVVRVAAAGIFVAGLYWFFARL